MEDTRLSQQIDNLIGILDDTRSLVSSISTWHSNVLGLKVYNNPLVAGVLDVAVIG